MAYKVIILYQLYMPSYFLGTFTEYPSFNSVTLTTLFFQIISPASGPQQKSRSRILRFGVNGKRSLKVWR